jgi:enamine deaminase RidA (YjgF/YER057c/UK114 family)
MRVEQELEQMGLKLPEPAAGGGVATLVPAVQYEKLLFVSGNTGARLHDIRGKVGRDVTVEQGYEAAKFCALGLLAAVKQAVGDLDNVDRIVKLTGFVNAPEGFTDSPRVVNGASDLLVKLYGDQGQHARSAIGVAALPGNVPVEVEMVLAVK